jgi:hypothetical protein
MPLMCGWFTSPCATSPTHATERVKGAAEGWTVSSIYRALVRNGLIQPKARRRRKADYRRWERARPMELWQLDVMGGIWLADGRELKAVTGHRNRLVTEVWWPRSQDLALYPQGYG